RVGSLPDQKGSRMIKQVIEKIVGSRHARAARKLEPGLAEIRRHEERLGTLSEEELRAQTARFRGIIDERTGPLKAEVDRLRQEKQDCADPVERDRLEDKLQKAEHAWKQEIANVLDELLP